MIPIQLRAKVFEAGARVETHTLQQIPLFTFLDFFRFRLIGWERAVRLMDHIRRYRQNLSESSWQCLTSFYPRHTYLLYYFLLFWWARYTGVTDELVHNPGKSLIAELFIRYFIEIDTLVDDPERVKLLNEPGKLKHLPGPANLLSELLRRIGSIDASNHTKRQICHSIWVYRKNSMSICQKAVERRSLSFSTVFSDKNNTSGKLFSVWAGILNLLYAPKTASELALSVQEILQRAGMAIQVADDMMDLPIDRATQVANLFDILLKETPDELSRIETHLGWIRWTHLDVGWARANLPITCSKAARVLDGILDEIREISRKPEISSELVHVLGLMACLGFGPIKRSTVSRLNVIHKITDTSSIRRKRVFGAGGNRNPKGV